MELPAYSPKDFSIMTDEALEIVVYYMQRFQKGSKNRVYWDHLELDIQTAIDEMMRRDCYLRMFEPYGRCPIKGHSGTVYIPWHTPDL